MHAVHLIEAQFKRDKESRDRAERFFDDLSRWISVPVETLERRALRYPDAFGFLARDFSKDEAFKDVLVLLAPSKDGSRSGGSTVRAGQGSLRSGKPVLVFYVLIAKGDLSHVDTRLSKDLVVHEAIHLLDSMRMRSRPVGSAKRRQAGGDVAYYNSPEEWNAYWQEGARSAESMAEKTPPKVWDYFFGDGSLSSFLVKAPSHFWNSEFVDNMTPETRRKFDKRLATFWDNVIKPLAKVKLRKKTEERELFEDEQQRMLRASATDDDHRLPNVHRIIPADRMKNIPYQGQGEVTIYRGIAPGDPNRVIRPGDWVALSKSYAKKHMKPGGRVLERKVPSIDVTWAGTDENEWFYTPLRKRSPDRGSIQEAVYDGNIGFEEMSWFYKSATKEQIDKMERLLKLDKLKEAWEFLKKVTGVKLRDR